MAVTRGTLAIARNLRRDIGAEVDSAARTLTGEWVDAWDGLAAAWQAAADDLVGMAARTGRWPSPAQILRSASTDAAMRGSIAALGKLADRTETVASQAADRVVRLDAEREPRIVASQAPQVEAPALARRVAGLAPVEALREAWALIEQARDDVQLLVLSRIRTDATNVMARRAAGQIHSDVLPLSDAAVESMRRELVRGVDVGDNPRTAAARMVANVEGQFNGGLTRALTIARTETLDAYRATSASIHAANADVVPGWQWYAELGPRTCSSCWAMHGQQFPTAEPGPDDHPVGRCTRLPVLASWAELGIAAPEPPSAMIDAQARFWALPESTRLAIMGPARLRLLDEGRIGWGDLSTVRQNAGWRRSRVPTPVRDLQRRAARGAPPTPTAVRPIPPPPAATPPPVPQVPPARLATTSLPLPAPRAPSPVLAERARLHAEAVVPDTLQAQIGAEMQRQAALTPRSMLQLEGVADTGDKFFSSFRNANAYYSFDDRQIYMHPQWADPLAQGYRSAIKSQGIAAGWNAPTGAATSAASTAAHEYGHHLHGQMRELPARQLQDFAAKLGEAMDLRLDTSLIHDWTFLNDQIEFAIRDNKQRIAEMVSEYGATSPLEMLAEIWQEYSTLGEMARPHIVEVGRLIQSVVG